MYLVSFYLFGPAANDYKPQSRLVVDNSTKKRYSAISFTTMQLPCFNGYRELFYDLNTSGAASAAEGGQRPRKENSSASQKI